MNLRQCIHRTSLLAILLGATMTARGAVKVRASSLLFFESFNDSTGQIELRNGARFGDAGSGVSGQEADKCYLGEVANVEAPEASAVALIKSVFPVRGLEEMTITVWYKPAEHQALDASLFDAGSMYLISGKNGAWVLRVGAANIPKNTFYWFDSNPTGPYSHWLQPNEWIFASFVWKKSANEACFYQGTKSAPVKKARCVTRNVTVGGLTERGDRDKRPDVLGNTVNPRYFRPFNGGMDNVRIYSKALDEAALDQIREADLKNEPPPEF